MSQVDDGSFTRELSPQMQEAIARLLAQGGGEFGGAIPQAPEFGASRPTKQPEPSAAFAGIPTDAYYNALAAKSQDPFFGGGHLSALKRDSAAGQNAYTEQLAQAQANTAEANASAGNTEVVLENIKGLSDGATDRGTGDIFGILDKSEVTRNRVNDQNTTDAGNREIESKAIKNLSDSNIETNTADVQELMTGPFAEELIEYNSLLLENGYSIDQSNDLIKAKADTMQAEASIMRGNAAIINANRPRSSGKSDDSDSDASGGGLSVGSAEAVRRILGN